MTPSPVRPDNASPLVGVLRRWWRKLYWLPRDLRTGWRLRRYAAVLVYGDSLGDNLLCTAVARELHRRGVGPIAMLTPVPELFRHNPHLHAIRRVDWGEVDSLRRRGRRLIRPDYSSRPQDSDRRPAPSRNVIADMCAAAGITGEVELRPEFFLQAGELASTRTNRRQIAIQSGAAGAAIRILNKEWPCERFQMVVDALRDRFEIVQIGTSADPPLTGTLDQRGRTTLRETAAILAASEAFIGLEGFLMHLARAVGRRSVIVYGGRVRPDQIGYPCNENLYTPVPCAPCWRDNTCDYEHRCLTEITPAAVAAALTRLLLRADEPMETESCVI